jgi:hypothetical protein
MQPEIILLIEKGKDIKLKISEMVKKYHYPEGNKNFILLGYYSILVEHHDAIHLLIQNELYGSAFALVRALYEPLFRAHWVGACATTMQIDKIIEGKDIFPKMEDMVEEMDRVYGTGDFWQKIKRNFWSAMNDYTHSGIRQLGRRFIEDAVKQNYDFGEVVEVLDGTNMALLMMALFFFNVHVKEKEIEIIKQMIIEYNDEVAQMKNE